MAEQNTQPAPGSITYTVCSGIATITLNNPRHRNALSPDMCRQLARAARRADTDAQVNAVVLRGAGGDFSAGASIGQVQDVLYAETGNGTTDLLSAADEALCAIRTPVVSVVEGICMGGGWQIAATADIVLASSTAKIALTPAKLGVVYPRRGLIRLVEHVGRHRAKQILLTGEMVPPGHAAAWGLVTEAVPAEMLEERLAELTATLQARSPYAAAQHKKLIDALGAVDATPDAFDRLWPEAWAGALTSGDLDEGRAAFAAKRNPVFPWRPH